MSTKRARLAATVEVLEEAPVEVLEEAPVEVPPPRPLEARASAFADVADLLVAARAQLDRLDAEHAAARAQLADRVAALEEQAGAAWTALADLAAEAGPRRRP